MRKKVKQVIGQYDLTPLQASALEEWAKTKIEVTSGMIESKVEELKSGTRRT